MVECVLFRVQKVYKIWVSSTLLEVVVVVEFRRGEERQVVAAVVDHRDALSCYEPTCASEQVGSHYDRPHGCGQDVSEELLHRVAIHGDHTYRCRPLVVLLVDALVQ